MTNTAHLENLQSIFLFLLILVTIFAVLAQRLKVPYPILLVLAGLGISFIPHVPRVRLDPNLVFLVLLPPLLYVSAWQTNWREFKGNLATIASLAVGLVAFTVWGVAEFADRFVTALDWKSGFLLGAVAATTDAIAAAAIAKSIGLPQRIVDLLEGESLVNDATGLLALEFGLRLLLRGDSPGFTDGALRFLWLIVGGVGVGLLLGVVVTWLERRVDDGPVEMTISLIVPYAAYLAGEQINASGVLAVVACGLFLSRRSVGFFSAETRIQVASSWNALNFILNGIVFLLMGLQLPYVLSGIGGFGHRMLMIYGAAFSGVFICLRLLWVYPASGLAYWIQTRLLHHKVAPYAPKSIFVVGWTGMRGVVALAAALSLPETLGDGRPFTQRNLIIFITFSIILVTLVVQGLTLPFLIRFLGLANAPGGGLSSEERDARRTVVQKAIEFLEEGKEASEDEADRHVYSDLLHLYGHRLESFSDHRDENERLFAERPLSRRRELILQVTQRERHTLIHLRDTGTIGDDTLRRLERELDLTEARQSRQY
ncbi:MAG: Na+/H+ antiporter [Janthinobacterium lividum]